MAISIRTSTELTMTMKIQQKNSVFSVPVSEPSNERNTGEESEAKCESSEIEETLVSVFTNSFIIKLLWFEAFITRSIILVAKQNIERKKSGRHFRKRIWIGILMVKL